MPAATRRAVFSFYASVGGSLEDVTIKNARQLGLNVNASQVTASGELAYEGQWMR